METALRTCPICRTPTHYITPSPVWPSSAEEKFAVIDGYRGKLKAIDCKHFAFGEGACPFGSSCFYRHLNRDGSAEEAPSLRWAGTADGGVRAIQPVRLSHFLEIAPQAQRLMRRR